MSDARKAFEQLQADGTTVMQEFQPFPTYDGFVMADPEGRWIEIMEYTHDTFRAQEFTNQPAGECGLRMVGFVEIVNDLQAMERLGRLDIVVNNAGIGEVGPTLEETPQDLLERVTRINQWGVFYGLKHAPGVMNDGGSIINTASLAAIIRMAGSGAYSATKAAVVSMTKMAALELGHRGIRVNAVCPGYIDTALGSGDEGKILSEQFTALGRVGTTEDLTGVFHFLAADECSYLTGQALIVDGGWTCGPTPLILETLMGSATVN